MDGLQVQVDLKVGHCKGQGLPGEILQLLQPLRDQLLQGENLHLLAQAQHPLRKGHCAGGHLLLELQLIMEGLRGLLSLFHVLGEFTQHLFLVGEQLLHGLGTQLRQRVPDSGFLPLQLLHLLLQAGLLLGDEPHLLLHASQQAHDDRLAGLDCLRHRQARVVQVRGQPTLAAQGEGTWRAEEPQLFPGVLLALRGLPLPDFLVILPRQVALHVHNAMPVGEARAAVATGTSLAHVIGTVQAPGDSDRGGLAANEWAEAACGLRLAHRVNQVQKAIDEEVGLELPDAGWQGDMLATRWAVQLLPVPHQLLQALLAIGVEARKDFGLTEALQANGAGQELTGEGLRERGAAPSHYGWERKSQARKGTSLSEEGKDTWRLCRLGRLESTPHHPQGKVCQGRKTQGELR